MTEIHHFKASLVILPPFYSKMVGAIEEKSVTYAVV